MIGVALITNRGFLDKRTYDGFRKTVEKEFNHIYVVDLGGDVRDDPKLSGTTHNVFGIKTGVAISFLVKHSKASGCQIRYVRRPQRETADEKLAFLSSAKAESIQVDAVRPNERHDWIDLADTDFSTLIPFISNATKYAKNRSQERAICKVYSLGISTNRDNWVVDFSKGYLTKKMSFFVKRYESFPASRFPES